MAFHHNHSLVAEVDETHFQSEVLSARLPVLVAFMAAWSQSCQAVEPVLEAVAESASDCLKVLKVNVDDRFDLSVWYEIQSIPTLLCFVNGKVCARVVGTVSEEAVLAKLKPFLAGA